MRARHWFAVLLCAALSVACGGGGGGGGGNDPCFTDPQAWGFNFYSNNVFFTRSLVKMVGGASQATERGRIEVDVPGCTLAWLFDVQFSGNQVRLLNFSVAPDSTCSPVQLQQGFGTGTANGNYGSASAVARSTSSGTLRYTLGGNTVGGPFTWEAFLQCP